MTTTRRRGHQSYREVRFSARPSGGALVNSRSRSTDSISNLRDADVGCPPNRGF